MEPAASEDRPSAVLTQPFYGSAAVAAGLVTPKQLRGPLFRRLFQDVYVPADLGVDLALRSRAAYLLVEGRGVLGGYSAAELFGASCGPANAPVEVVVPGGRQNTQPGLLVRRGRLLPGEVIGVAGIMVTSPLRTAYDLARRGSLTEAVVAVDALSHACGFAPQDVVAFGRRHLGARGSARLPEVVRLSNPLSDSPMETRIRLAIVLGGLPEPVLQHPIGPYLLDMAYPRVRLAVEYDGRDHLTQERAARDLARQAYLSRAGWEILRFRATVVLNNPRTIAATVRSMISTKAT